MINGFSKLSKKEKQELLLHFLGDTGLINLLNDTLPKSSEVENLIDSFSENVVGNYPFPFSIAPNFLIDGKDYMVPMVVEESSVVAAASKAAKFWHAHGGFKTKIRGFIKHGHVHFKWLDDSVKLYRNFIHWKIDLHDAIKELDEKMQNRGGGVRSIELIDKTAELNNYFQLKVGFDTRDAMGANYMNTILEQLAIKLEQLVSTETDSSIKIIMSILSNYSPENAIHVFVEAPINEMGKLSEKLTGIEYAEKFIEALQIAENDVSRAVTHNKGLYNGVDAVALATGNDWRAIEANGHAFASRNGKYQSLSHASILNGVFRFEATIPMQIGTVGGITSLHPMAKLAMKIMGNPGAKELMKVIASVGLAQNFAAVNSLITTGIQSGHMKMHLSNILLELNANTEESRQIQSYFSGKSISKSAVEKYLHELREK